MPSPNRALLRALSLHLLRRYHKYAVRTGAEITGGGWPELVTRKPVIQKQAAALATANVRSGASYLYVTTSSYGDAGDYQGHLATINLASGAQHVFNALCSDRGDVHFAAAPARLWRGGCGDLEPGRGRIRPGYG